MLWKETGMWCFCHLVAPSAQCRMNVHSFIHILKLSFSMPTCGTGLPTIVIHMICADKA